MVGLKTLAVAGIAITSFAEAQTSSSAGPLPTVDLGYAVHRPTLNESGYPYYNFSNIRFGAPPTGSRRFAAPISPISINRTVNDGQDSRVCPQAGPAWFLTAIQWLGGVPVANLSQSSAASGGLSALPKPIAGTNEDCLFLDVIVPTAIYNSRKAVAKRAENTNSSGTSNSTGAPVLVWIYGGGFTSGSKGSSGNPASLLARARDDGEDGLVYVALNYRLGAYGWLGGPTFQENGTANAGLYDQRLGLEWVQKNIHLFGGDPNQVTVIGESAGGSSILHQITAFGGLNGKAPFKRAITQSPGFLPLPSNNQNEAVFLQTLALASYVSSRSISTLEQLRTLNDTELYLTNAAVTGLSPYGSFTFGPTVDGRFAPKLPGELLLNGQFDKDVQVMTGHNANEGLLFTSPFVNNETSLYAFVKQSVPAATNATINYVLQTLYPPTYDGSHGYIDVTGRLALLLSEFSFTCNTRYLDKAYNNQTYSYYFTVPPGLHGEDIAYTFFNGDTTTINDGLPVNATVATLLQDYLTSFAMTGTPNEPGVPFFPLYSANSTNTNIGLTNLGGQVNDTAANARCDYWQKGLYF